MISKGDWQNIYDQDRQIAEQRPFMGNEHVYLPFGYPPHAALIYWPLSILQYRLAYVVHTAIMVLALLWTLHLIRPMSEQLNKHFLCAFTLTASFFPIFKAITGGQNTSITLLLIALSWKALKQDKTYLAGLYTGLMLFKPQFAIPLTGVYLLSGRWRIGVTFGLVAIISYILGVLMLGPDWLAVWFENAKWQVQAYSVIDKENAVSLMGFTEAVLGAGGQWASIIGWALTTLTVTGISLLWWADKTKGDLTALIAMTSVCLVLIPPHVIFYDAGLLLLACVAITSRPIRLKAELLGMIWILSWSQTIADFIGFSPLFFITIGIGALAAVILVKPALASVSKV